ncbi:MAG: hypothetical protein J7K68_04750 [Candidatus Diapherotrites archaeon]|nr:hypothetical protein [Candidatus Diapherotrites archaeon]
MKARDIFFILLFAAFVFIGANIKVLPILGVTDKAFTLVQFFAPIAGGILGPFLGILAVILAEGARITLTGAVSFASIVTLFTMSAAAFFFGVRNRKLGIIVPAACMVLFWLHPSGQQVPYYVLYWLIPIVASLKWKDTLLARSVGSTFTAHAIGSVAYLYAFNIPPEVWIALIPIVAIERALFASGIITSYVIVNTVLDKFEQYLPSFVRIDSKYILGRLFRLQA